MNDEPFYVKQCRAPKTSDQRDNWFKQQAVIAREKGAVWCRYSFHPDDDSRTIIEAWKIRPRREGAVRWQVSARDEMPALN